MYISKKSLLKVWDIVTIKKAKKIVALKNNRRFLIDLPWVIY